MTVTCLPVLAEPQITRETQLRTAGNTRVTAPLLGGAVMWGSPGRMGPPMVSLPHLRIWRQLQGGITAF